LADREDKGCVRHTFDRSYSGSTSSRNRAVSSTGDKKTPAVVSQVTIPEKRKYQSETAIYKKSAALRTSPTVKVDHQWTDKAFDTDPTEKKVVPGSRPNKMIQG
jgi:hypothetical protein